uniref:Uncharacterized protein n=1 Tax=Sinocyclocheilus rhinocerous TaxID=307959 RepID=A0A673GSU5_9TELE
MAKNKQRGKKQQNVFQVATKQSKPKTKAKPVKTSLKHTDNPILRRSNRVRKPPVRLDL